jgi:hypothetical protein
MLTLHRLILAMDTLFCVAIKESINEEPDEGNLQVRFCEGHAPPCTEFIKTLNLVN